MAQCVALRPLVFQVDDFLTKTECWTIRKQAKAAKLRDSSTVSAGNRGTIVDANEDGKLTPGELRLTIEQSFDAVLNEKDLDDMFKAMGVSRNPDGSIDVAQWRKEWKLHEFVLEWMRRNPLKTVRASKTAWLRKSEQAVEFSSTLGAVAIDGDGIVSFLVQWRSLTLDLWQEQRHV